MRNDAFTDERLFETDVPLAGFGPPEIIDIEPVHDCNLRCVMCHVSYEHLTRESLNVEALRRTIQSLPLRGRWAVVGATHEPTMHPAFDEIVAILTEAGMKIDLTTNGSTLTGKLIDKIKTGRFGRVCISFDGARKQTYEKIRRNANFERTLERVRAFKETIGNAETYWVANYTMTKSTVQEISEAVDLWDGMDFDMIGFIAMVLRSHDPSFVAERLDGLQEEIRANLLAVANRVLSEHRRIALASSVYSGMTGNNVVVSDHPGTITATNCRPYFQEGEHPDVQVACRSPYKHARITWNGNVFLCFDKFVIGNINVQPLSEIWYGGAADKIRTMIKGSADTCHSCDFYKFCIKAGSVDIDDPANWTSRNIVEAA